MGRRAGAGPWREVQPSAAVPLLSSIPLIDGCDDQIFYMLNGECTLSAVVCMGVPHLRPVAPCWLITPCGGNEIVCALVTFNLVYIFERSASAVADPTISFFFSTTGPVRLAVRSSASDTTIRVWRRETTSTGPLDYRRLQLTPSISIRAYVGSLGHDRLLGAWP